MSEAATIKLVTKKDETPESVRTLLSDLCQRATDEEYMGLAVVMIRHDGTPFVATRGNGNRVMLLGAVTDLQYTLAKSGDG